MEKFQDTGPQGLEFDPPDLEFHRSFNMFTNFKFKILEYCAAKVELILLQEYH